MLRIGEFSKLTGVSIGTLRYYDEIDLFKPKEIDLFTNYRYYTEEQIEDIKLINKLKSLDFTLDEIKDNWNNFTNELFLKKKQEIESKLLDINIKIKEIDKLRSKIVNGRFTKEESTHKNKIKTLF